MGAAGAYETPSRGGQGCPICGTDCTDATVQTRPALGEGWLNGRPPEETIMAPRETIGPLRGRVFEDGRLLYPVGSYISRAEAERLGILEALGEEATAPEPTPPPVTVVQTADVPTSTIVTVDTSGNATELPATTPAPVQPAAVPEIDVTETRSPAAGSLPDKRETAPADRAKETKKPAAPAQQAARADVPDAETR